LIDTSADEIQDILTEKKTREQVNASVGRHSNHKST